MLAGQDDGVEDGSIVRIPKDAIARLGHLEPLCHGYPAFAARVIPVVSPFGHVSVGVVVPAGILVKSPVEVVVLVVAHRHHEGDTGRKDLR